jgi:hypothetical protein
MIAMMKYTGGLGCFFCNIFLTLYTDDIIDVVKDFVAVAIIAEVDNLMAGTVTADESDGSMKLYVSNDRMKMTDIEIFK